jgi:hypothetical protein
MLMAVAGKALAVDGVHEINQSCAVNTGCFPGDDAGFPVMITESGSYRLTGNLSTSVSAISLPISTSVDNVTVDLNGFTVSGDASTQNGIQLWAGNNWEIRNGTVIGFVNGIQQGQTSSGHRVIGVRVLDNSRRGIQISAGGAHRVEGCTVTGNGANGNLEGINIGSNSTVVGNTVANNFGFGVALGGGTGYADNVVNNNGLGTVAGGVEMGVNVCDANTVCP